MPFADGTTFKEITPAGYVEGVVHVREGRQVLLHVVRGRLDGAELRGRLRDRLVAVRARSSASGKILQQDPAVATGAGHHSVLHAPGSDNWYIVYHRRPLGETDRNHRVVCIDELRFDASGAILPVVITKDGVLRDPISANER